MKIWGYVLVIGATVLLMYLCGVSIQLTGNVRREQDFIVEFKSISSILRATLTAVYADDENVYVGDDVGSLSLWAYDKVHKKLEFKDMSRQIAATLPPHNKVIDIKTRSQGAVVLTDDGLVSVYHIYAAKIDSKIDIILQAPLQQFTLFSIGNDLILAGIHEGGDQICLYKLHQSLTVPNPVTRFACNSTAQNLVYSGIDYDPINQLVSVGDATRAILFRVQTDQLVYLCEAYLQKAQGIGFKSIFSKSGALIAINEAWLSSIVIDMSVPYAKVISSVRTGTLSWLSVNRDSVSSTTIVINPDSQIDSYHLNQHNKLTHTHNSLKFGKLHNFNLLNSKTMFATVNQCVIAIHIAEIEGFTEVGSYAIESHNHFAAVTSLKYSGGYLVTGSDAAKDNLKLWKLKESQLMFVNQQTVELSSQFMGLSQMLILKHEQGHNNDSFSVAAAGSAPFNIILVTVNMKGEFGTVIKSKSAHQGNVTSLFLGFDRRTLVTSSLDGYIKAWKISTNYDKFEGDAVKTIATSYGQIRAGASDSKGIYFLYGHSQSLKSQLANITLWKFDQNEGVIKLAENVPWEAHESNITQLRLSSDQRYFITLSEVGQLRLWQHKQWTAVDLLASLALGFADCSIVMISSDALIIETPTEFIKYVFDFNGFVLIGRSKRTFASEPTSSTVVGDRLISGDSDGAIRIYALS